MNKLR